VQRWRKHPARIAAVSALVLVGMVTAATFPLFVYPAKDAPGDVDAIVVLGGDPRRLTLGLKLAAEGYSPTLLVSTSPETCPAPPARVRVVCFQPHPATTQGEARYVASAAMKNNWKKLIVVSSVDQTTRARIRFKRCTNVEVRYVPSATPVQDLPFRIAYEWGALAKALLLQRGC
jgi:uncharacterized SAM-binding protein YcdF (DUF218 family)